jgi:ribose-phosphate pyrophosphokinase
VTSQIKFFAGNANLPLAHAVVKHLGVLPTRCKVSHFSDGEVWVEIDESVRGHHSVILQSTSSPVNENLMQLLVMIDALKRASSDEITVVMPYYGYARQDRKASPRAPITAKLVADLLTAAGATRVVSMDLHAPQIQGFFNVPFDHLYAMPVILQDIKIRLGPHLEDLIVVAPDAGGVERARMVAKRLQCGLAIIDKRRTGPNIAEILHIIGDVKAKRAVIIDDLVDTAGTLTQGTQALVNAGAAEVWAYATHAVLSGQALERLQQSPLKHLVVTDTIALTDQARNMGKISQITVAQLIAETIQRIYAGESLSDLFV